MNNLVFLAPNTQEPFTTSKVIADRTGMNHRRVKEAIRKHEHEIRSFGLLGAYATESSGGRPEEIYRLNEQQATFLMTLLKNTPIVVDFKAELVRQFYAMRFELYKVQAAKMERRPVRASMTDAIKALPDSPHKAMKYGQYTNLAYLLALGKTASQVRKERGAKKRANASDYMTAEEISLVSEMENRIAVLIGIGMSYQEVKKSLTRNPKF